MKMQSMEKRRNKKIHEENKVQQVKMRITRMKRRREMRIQEEGLEGDEENNDQRNCVAELEMRSKMILGLLMRVVPVEENQKRKRKRKRRKNTKPMSKRAMTSTARQKESLLSLAADLAVMHDNIDE